MMVKKEEEECHLPEDTQIIRTRLNLNSYKRLDIFADEYLSWIHVVAGEYR